MNYIIVRLLLLIIIAAMKNSKKQIVRSVIIINTGFLNQGVLHQNVYVKLAIMMTMTKMSYANNAIIHG